MTATLTAVYRGGVFHPTTTPPDLADGATVELTVATTPAMPPADEPHPYDVLSAITRRSARPAPAEAVSANVDKYLYGEPGDPGNVR